MKYLKLQTNIQRTEMKVALSIEWRVKGCSMGFRQGGIDSETANKLSGVIQLKRLPEKRGQWSDTHCNNSNILLNLHNTQ